MRKVFAETASRINVQMRAPAFLWRTTGNALRRLFELLLAKKIGNGIKNAHGFAIPNQFIKEKADAGNGG
jgi:hypothetical protein